MLLADINDMQLGSCHQCLTIAKATCGSTEGNVFNPADTIAAIKSG